MDTLVELFQQHSRRLATLVSIVMLILLMSSLAQTTSFFLENMNEGSVTPIAPTPTQARPTAPKVDLARLNLFGRVAEQQVVQTVDAPETKLNLELKGVFIADDPDNSTAIVSERNKDGQIYRIGERLPGNAVLSAIFDDHILLRRGGRVEKLMFSDAKLRFTRTNTNSVPRNLGTSTPRAEPVERQNVARTRLQRLQERKTNRRDALRTQNPPKTQGQSIRDYVNANLDKIKQNPGALLSQAGLSPVSEGSASGYRVSGSQAAMTNAGLRAGDVILSVNGQPVGNAANDTGLIQGAINAGRVRVEVQRAERKFYLTVPIPE